MESRSDKSRSANEKRGRSISALSRSYSADLVRGQNAGAFRPRLVAASNFRKYYERGDLPLFLESDARGHKLIWKTDIKNLDLRHFMPIFFDGLSDTKHPYNFFAFQGTIDLIAAASDKILPLLPTLIMPLKKAMSTRNHTNMVMALKVLQKMVMTCAGVGETIVHFYRQLLPILNAFKAKNYNIGDNIEYGQRRKENLGDLIEETLTCLEINGGPDALINIKYSVPTYQSCVLR